MKIAVANYPITFHASLADWKAHVEKWLSEVGEADLAVFPEYGSLELVSLLDAGTREDARVQIVGIQQFHDEFLAVYGYLAQKFGLTVVAPSFPLYVGGKWVNRAYVFTPDGLAGYQDKLFMTPFEKEWGISGGTPELSLFQSPKGSFGIQICYDAEFAIGSQELARAGADIILVPSCTETVRGAARVHVGARARALENQCYTIVSQTVGEALWTPTVDYNYGYCGAYSTPDLGFPEWGILQTGTAQQPGWMIQEFDLSLLEKVRKEGGVLNFSDGEEIVSILNGERLKIKRVPDNSSN